MKATPASTAPRLLDLKAASSHSGIPLWSLRRLIWNGVIPVVKLPALDGRGGPMRRVLIDRVDLDRWIDGQKETVRQ